MTSYTFLYDPKNEPACVLGENLTKRYNGVTLPEADILVAIGGDGSVLHALAPAQGRPVLGIKPPGTTSVGYTANHFEPCDDLPAIMAAYRHYPICPIIADIIYANGARKTQEAYSMLSLRRDNAQAAMLTLTGHFAGVAQTTKIMGDGLAFATALGSTGLTWSHGGPVIAPDHQVMIMTGMGIAQPRGFNAIISTASDSYSINCTTSNGKRPLKIDVDSVSIRMTARNPFVAMDIHLSARPTATIIADPANFHPLRRLMIG